VRNLKKRKREREIEIRNRAEGRECQRETNDDTTTAAAD
jgi:hypothetical protein